MNKKELIDAVASKTGETKASVQSVVDEFMSQVQGAIASGDKVTLPGFGTFSRRDRAARTARNPRTGEEISIPATQVPGFKAGAAFKDAVAGR